ncbi:MAG: hypothetical protein IJO57_00965 [Bacilli bacterium]|nr:hypothetical protein [Bacilli bacterium]
MDKKINFKYLMTASTFAFLLLIMAIGGSLSKGSRSLIEYDGKYFKCAGKMRSIGNNYYCCSNSDNIGTRPFSTKEACDEWKKKSYPFVENVNYYINFNSGTTDTTCSVSYYSGCAGINPVYNSSSSSSSSTVSTSGECSVSITASEVVTGGATFQVTATTKINGSGVSVKSYTWNSGGTGYLLGSGPNGTFNSSSNTDVRSFTSVAVDGTKVAGSVMVTLSNGKTCSSSFSSTVKVDDGSDDENVVVTKFMSGDSLVDSKTCYLKDKEPLCQRGISTPGPQSKEGYTFNGWGNSKSCTSSTLASNYNITPSTSMVYYACFINKTDDPELPDDFTYSKCTYGIYASVVNDERYLGCKYVGVGYGTSTSDRADRNITTVKTCCLYKGYTWVRENYDAFGGEYCIMCGGSSSSKPSISSSSSKPSSSSSSSKPSSSSSSSSKPSSSSSIPSSSSLNNPIDNPKTGTALIFIVWSIGISIIIYSVWYFKNSKGNA